MLRFYINVYAYVIDRYGYKYGGKIFKARIGNIK